MTDTAIWEPADTNWEPGTTCYVTPAAVIVCGSVPGDEVRAMRDNVHDRLGTDFPPGAVRWAQIPFSADVSEDTIKAVVEPLLELELWQSLVSRGYAQELPGDEHPLSLQAIVVCYLEGNDESADAARFLQSLATALRKALPENTLLSLALIAVGESALDLVQDDLYWPRIRLQTDAFGGALASRGRVLEVCQTIIVAFLTSELVRAITHAVGSSKQSVGWIWMGASVLVVDLPPMREFLQLLVFRDLIQPLIEAPLTLPGQQHIDGVVEMVQDFQAATLVQALSITSSFSWDHEIEAKGEQHIQRFVLRPGTELKARVQALAGDLADPLAAHCVTLRDGLIENLGQAVNAQYDRLVDVFAFLMEPSAISDSGKGSPLSLQETWSSGLLAAIHAVESTTAKLKDTPDAYFEGKALRPHPMGSDSFLTTVAESAASDVQAGLRHHVRLSRTILSPLGLALRLIPAWPLLTGALGLITEWNEAQATLISGLSLLAVGLAELIFWRIRAKKLLGVLGRQLEEEVAGLALGLMAKVLRDYRLCVVGRFSDSLSTLKHLLTLLQKVNVDVRKHLGALDAWEESPRPEATSVYRLADLGICREWAEQASRQVNATRARSTSFATALLAERAFSLLRRSSSYRRIVYRIRQVANDLAEDFFRSDVLEAHVLAEREEALEGGKRWQWLYQRAHPLGGTAGAEPSLTVVTLAGDAPLMGAAGQSSDHWKTGWLVARSRQPHEIICVRGIVERRDRDGMD